MNNTNSELLMVFPSRGMCIELYHDERDEGFGYYVDFMGINANVGSGCVYYSDDLNLAISYAKDFSENFSFEDVMHLDNEYEY